mmetsp:Transcript_42682/g.111211  ORF Transcript_42682/g.111211 Transcript_42682/m.111211 type:complete len:206 (+) Transcript_42682:1693-2310(+)
MRLRLRALPRELDQISECGRLLGGAFSHRSAGELGLLQRFRGVRGVHDLSWSRHAVCSDLPVGLLRVAAGRYSGDEGRQGQPPAEKPETNAGARKEQRALGHRLRAVRVRRGDHQHLAGCVRFRGARGAGHAWEAGGVHVLRACGLACPACPRVAPASGAERRRHAQDEAGRPRPPRPRERQGSGRAGARTVPRPQDQPSGHPRV